ncbi:hypothetical protein B0H65DRAFT_443215 [Neurospora tetraspora]|uniref:Uncharacterized protein n=1 Tax=Neurospora tetraspora TaxID=94610 RepID=A0AAE0MQH7_9PEZI|nr:hypothetical protein B0H65DRAFT_443215 [Neurospora tetraspora]
MSTQWVCGAASVLTSRWEKPYRSRLKTLRYCQQFLDEQKEQEREKSNTSTAHYRIPSDNVWCVLCIRALHRTVPRVALSHKSFCSGFDAARCFSDPWHQFYRYMKGHILTAAPPAPNVPDHVETNSLDDVSSESDFIRRMTQLQPKRDNMFPELLSVTDLRCLMSDLVFAILLTFFEHEILKA